MESRPQRSFVRALLPWMVAAVMLLLYLVTLDRVVTTQSVFPLARAAGFEWQASYVQPVSWLVTLPVRWLPAGIQLSALNFIAALCAALSLALLARSVALLPHDRTELQRDKLRGEDSFLDIRLAWVPVVFAVLVCGLQLSFWEQAIINTGEALDLLLFAYCVRCLLEYRVDERSTWLNKMAVVYGVAVTNNFAMIAFFPAALVALLWIKGLRFFRFDFLARMFLLGVAGLSLYLLLPLIQMNSEIQPTTFWQALKTNLLFQKQYLMGFPRWRAGWVGLYALLPLLLAGIRWRSGFGDTSAVGSSFTNIFAQILHAGLLVFCLYIAFDPPAGPREFGLGMVFLPCYFLAALSIGYYTGFLLLVFSNADGMSRRRSAVPPIVNQAVTAVVCAGALFVVGKLAMQNFPKIRAATSPALHDYATALVASLPDKPSIVLSDDQVRLFAVAAVLAREGNDKHVLLKTASLSEPGYHIFLRQRYGDRWPKLEVEQGYVGINPQQMVRAFTELSAKHELIYLHPSFGAYFETFHLEPRQHVYALKAYAPNVTEAPLPTAALVAQQSTAWNALAQRPWKSLKATLATLPSEPQERAEHGAAFVGAYYSRALNWWGVELQRANRFDEAAKFFDEALALNPDNAAAMINQEANTLWRKEKKRLPSFSKKAEEKLQYYRGIDNLINACGPLDLPEFCMEFAQTFVRGGLYRQAAQMVERALAYAPDDLIYGAARANVELIAGQPDKALANLSRVSARAGTAVPQVQIEIERIRAFAQMEKNNFSVAEQGLEAIVKKFPGEDASHNALSQLYVMRSSKLRAANDPAAGVPLTNAIRVIERQMKAQPQNPSARFNHGNLLMSVGDYAGAAADFTELLRLQKDNTAALLNRAICYLLSKKLEEAKRDYRELVSRYTTTDFRVYYGLGEIAYQQQDWTAAKEYFADYLRYAPANSGEAAAVRKKLDEAKKKS